MPDNETVVTETPTSRLIMRPEFQAYMNTSDTSTASYELIGEGFTSLTEAKNAKEYSRQYIHEYTERTDVVGYAPTLSYSVDAHTENNVIAKIIAVTDHELTGADAQVDIVCVNLFEATETTNVYSAYQRKWAIIPDGKGDGTDALIYTGSLRAVGDITPGTFNTSSKTFSATT